MWPHPALTFYDDFAQLLPRQEKFHGIELTEQFLQAAIIEELHRRTLSALDEHERIEGTNAERIARHRPHLLFHMEERQQIALRPYDPGQALDGGGQQRRS